VHALQEVVTTLAEELLVPGVAVGVLHDGQEHHAFHGVTSIDNPLPVDGRTLFLCGSTTKTFTATAIVRLVEQGVVDLDATVRTYLPGFRVEDDHAAASVTVGQILNHTAGWDGDFFKNTGEGDDALALYIEAMAGLQQMTRPGEVVSYNNASFGVAGRVIEQVTGTSYEAALRTLLLEPLGLEGTLFFSRELLTRRFAVDHQRLQDGGTTVLKGGFPRATNPVGGLATTTRDLIAWARFHLGDGAGIVSSELVRLMREPTVQALGWSAGDAVGRCSATSAALPLSGTAARRRASSLCSRRFPSAGSRSSPARTAVPSARSSTTGSCGGRGRPCSKRRCRSRRPHPERPTRSRRSAVSTRRVRA
jgi:CubicO group peptidase (beta-lactamase class C family)